MKNKGYKDFQKPLRGILIIMSRQLARLKYLETRSSYTDFQRVTYEAQCTKLCFALIIRPFFI